jgi:hypothetical protein
MFGNLASASGGGCQQSEGGTTMLAVLVNLVSAVFI